VLQWHEFFFITGLPLRRRGQYRSWSLAEEADQSLDVLGHNRREELLMNKLKSPQAQAAQTDLNHRDTRFARVINSPTVSRLGVVVPTFDSSRRLLLSLILGFVGLFVFLHYVSEDKDPNQSEGRKLRAAETSGSYSSTFAGYD